MNLVPLSPRVYAAFLLCLTAACGSSDEDTPPGGASSGTSGGTSSGSSGGASSSTSGGTSGGTSSSTSSGTGGAPGDTPEFPDTPRGDLLEDLWTSSRAGKFRFGYENAITWGLYDPGTKQFVSTNDWFSSMAGAASRGERGWSSDAGATVGENPGLLGISLDAMVFDPVPWNRRDVTADAAAYMLEQPGGMVAFDWHTPPCNYDISTSDFADAIETPLATLSVDGQSVPIHAQGGGTPFYAETYYSRSLGSSADIPENLKCICKIANDVPIEQGTHAGISARDWLVAHAKYVAQFFREHGLDGKPIVLRPFHEHTGGWFWWGQPYWNCQALLDDDQAVTGPAAYSAAYRTFAEAVRSEPGMENVIFAYSTDKVRKLSDSSVTPAEAKVRDPESLSRDMLRARLVEELTELGAAYESPPQEAIAALENDGQPPSALLEEYYLEAYPGDDLIDILGIDLYYPYERAASPADLEDMKVMARAVAAIGAAKGKPHALTETGTYRLHLLHRVSKLAAGASLTLYPADHVSKWHDTLFDEGLRTEFLANYGLGSAGAVALSSAEVTSLFPDAGQGALTEDWYNTHLLDLAKSAGVAYALTWQTYYDGSDFDNKAVYYYVPFPGHPEADNFRRFADDPAVCFGATACQ
ncbi:glycosyl hydrolase [Sorangium sp. So ce302]|uniref:glycosyl hydrolase n=1 Tax=Sorangium sp. So ce302 TaxID=3133297 RepID=UPI003F5F0CBE